MPSSPFAPPDPLFSAAPSQRRVAFLSAQPFAHRGLHGPGAPENSRAAFRAAIAIGHGIECDIQPAADGTPFVFHDDDLDRLTAERGPVAARMPAALSAIALTGGDESIPRLDEVLALVDGRVPMLIEIKAPDRHVAPLCQAVRRALEGYRGAAAVMSFNPLVSRWFHDHEDRIVRGLVMTEEGRKGLLGGLVRRLTLRRARPDFLAYDIRDLPSRFAGRARARGMPVLTWTVRSPAQRETAAAFTDQIIYERMP